MLNYTTIFFLNQYAIKLHFSTDLFNKVIFVLQIHASDMNYATMFQQIVYLTSFIDICHSN